VSQRQPAFQCVFKKKEFFSRRNLLSLESIFVEFFTFLVENDNIVIFGKYFFVLLQSAKEQCAEQQMEKQSRG
jgi:hypothetical protein